MQVLLGTFLMVSFIIFMFVSQILMVATVVALMKPKRPKRKVVYDKFEEAQD